MKQMFRYIFSLLVLSTVTLSAADANMQSNAPLKIRVINFKNCVESSKLGKQEQATFEAMKKQMETVLTEKEKVLNDMAEKFEDEDYLDGLSVEAETEMKRKFRSLNQELTQLQQQYYQALQQTNFKVVQKMTEAVSQASKSVAKRFGLDLIVNDEVSYFANPSLDISSEIVKVMDQTYDAAPKADTTTK